MNDAKHVMDAATIATAERILQITLTDAERQLLCDTVSPRLRSPIDAQRRYILVRALTPMQCAGCLGVTSRRAARPQFSEERSTPDDAYECQLCTARLVYHMGLTGDEWFTLAPGQIIAVPAEAPLRAGPDRR